MSGTRGWVLAGGVLLAALLWPQAALGVTVATGLSEPSPVSGDAGRVVWSDRGPDGDFDVFVHDVITGGTRRLTPSGSDQVNPAISGDWVVWADFRNGDADIYGCNLTTSEERRITFGPYDQNSPDISGDWVVFEEYQNLQTEAVWAYNLATGFRRAIESNSSVHKTRPRIGGSLIVWEDRLGVDSNVRAFDLATSQVFNVAATSLGELLPDTDGRWVTWVQPGGAKTGLDVFAYDRVTGRRLQVRLRGEQTLPSVGGGRLYWVDVMRGARVGWTPLRTRGGVMPHRQKTPDVWSVDAGGGTMTFLARDPTSWRIGAYPDAATKRSRVALLARRGLTALASLLQPSLPEVALGTRAPTVPGFPQVTVKRGERVGLSWNASSDPDGDPVVYDIYRRNLPMPTSVEVVLGTLVVSGVSGTSTEVALAPDEVQRRFTYYYVVVARDPSGNVSAPSYSIAPDPHGTHRTASNVWNCRICHPFPHGGTGQWGALGANTRGACYRCHGGTDAASSYGVAAASNAQRQFRDYPGQTGTRHRNAYMEGQESDCSVCHTPHRSPYYVNASGAYEPTQSHRGLLRVTEATNPAAYRYSTDSTPVREAFCLTCHGSTATPMLIAGGPTAYALTGGDHLIGYASSGHGTPTVYAVNANPGIQCEVCHDAHGSPVARLVDYRRSGTTTTANAEGGLCLRCHDPGSTETSVAPGNVAPFTWNGRAPRTEFARYSAHPTATSPTGRSATCANCHNAHLVTEGSTNTAWDVRRISLPTNTKQTPSDVTAFCVGCHSPSPPVAGWGASFVVPYSVGFSLVSAPYFPGWDKSGFTAAGHYSTTGTKALCQNCHDPHGSDLPRLSAWTRPAGWTTGTPGTRNNTSSVVAGEENLCLNCHGNNTVGKLATAAADVATPLGALYGHPTTDFAGRHSDTETGAGLGGAGRHAECTDCHDPHYARRTGGSALHRVRESTAGGALHGVWGVRSTIATNWTTPTADDFATVRIDGESGDHEAYVCFKCHSNALGVEQPSGQTNIALEFNTYNYSRHNVLGSSVGGKSSFVVTGTAYTWTTPTVGVFVTGWNWNSKLTCTDCHTGGVGGQARGPHGSSIEFLLDPAYPADWKTAGLIGSGSGITTDGSSATTAVLCAKCHDLYDDGVKRYSNSAHGQSSHNRASGTTCNSCHIGIPHGWKRPRLLGYESDPLPYAVRSGHLRGVQVVGHSLSQGGANWGSGNCLTGCSSHSTSPIWP